MEQVKLTREELYQLVWSTPMIRLAKKYHLSDNGLRKICKKYKIPIPYLGYWSKVKHGKKLKPQPVLPEIDNNESITISIVENKGQQRDWDRKELNAQTELIKKDTRLEFNIKKRLIRPHPLVKQARAFYNERISWSHLSNGCTTTRHDVLTIKVAPKNLPRALRIFDAIIGLVLQRGHDIVVEDTKSKLNVNGQKLDISISEACKVNKNRDTKDFWNRGDYLIPTGILCLGVGEKGWSEEKAPFEQYLPEILAWTELHAKVLEIRQKRWEKERRIWEEERRVKEEIADRKKEEKEKYAHLLRLAKRWRDAEDIRGLTREMEKRNVNFNEDMKSWLTWSNNKAEWVDPCTNRNDEILVLYDETQ